MNLKILDLTYDLKCERGGNKMDSKEIELKLLQCIKQENIEEWNTFRNKFSGQIEVSFLPIIGRDINGINLSNLLIKKIEAKDSNFTSSSFQNTVIEQAIIEKSIFKNVLFDNANLDGIDFSNIDLSSCSFKSASLKNVNLTNTDFEKSFYLMANLDNSIGLEFSYLEDRKMLDVYEERVIELTSALETILEGASSEASKEEVEKLKNDIKIYSEFIERYKNKTRLNTLFEEKIKKISLDLTNTTKNLNELEKEKEEKINLFYKIANYSFLVTILMFIIYWFQINSMGIVLKSASLGSVYLLFIFPIIFTLVVSIIFYGMATKRIKEKQVITEKQLIVEHTEAIMKAYVHLYNESFDKADSRIEVLLNDFSKNVLGNTQSGPDIKEEAISLDKMIKILPTLAKAMKN